MKKTFILIIALSTLLLITASASAQPGHRDRPGDRDHRPDHRYSSRDDGNDRHWRHDDSRNDRDNRMLPFRWRDHQDSIRNQHRLEPFHDRGWNDRFPGERAYRWHDDRGFWHHGHYVNEAVLFFDDGGRLISIGYVADGVFIRFREDDRYHESRDSFFFSWQRH